MGHVGRTMAHNLIRPRSRCGSGGRCFGWRPGPASSSGARQTFWPRFPSASALAASLFLFSAPRDSMPVSGEPPRQAPGKWTGLVSLHSAAEGFAPAAGREQRRAPQAAVWSVLAARRWFPGCSARLARSTSQGSQLELSRPPRFGNGANACHSPLHQHLHHQTEREDP